MTVVFDQTEANRRPVLPEQILAADFVRAGAVAVGLGGWLMGDCQAAGVESRARQVVAAIAAARRERSPSSREAGS